MALQCAHCHKPMSISKISGTRGKGLSSHIQCYHCQAWLGRHRYLTMLKILGFYTAVGAGLTGYFVAGLANIITPVIMLSLILTGVTHLMDHLLVIEAPEEGSQTN
ncbi:hypothetical protein [Shewanella sp. 6_MG-2023]|uniref:hypothetical protein n=1 Tax=Shewanella sp. 6_MG-2023 TaxID=3062660 RepID=UPI0026E3C9FF|nr:hypothetical protein [Shewanella sp. 6_MG-2023]MDO6620264.1 hypothetical protein [Shewanella sp. 6_MG-2023]